jgi:hypothetical protein
VDARGGGAAETVCKSERMRSEEMDPLVVAAFGSHVSTRSCYRVTPRYY